MSQKIKIVLVMAVILSLAGSVLATDFWDWGMTADWASGTAAWRDNGGANPSPSPTTADTAIMYWGGTLTVTTQDQGSYNLWMGYQTGFTTLDIAPGIDFLVTNDLLLGTGGGPDVTNGTLNIGQGASVECGQLVLGWQPFKHGTINVADGGLLIAGPVGTSVGLNATGTINLSGTGSMIAMTAITIGEGSYIDIQQGTFKVYGDERSSLAFLIGAGRITGYNGTGLVNAPVLGTGDDAGWTIVTAQTQPEPASNPVPADGQRKVVFDTVLSWVGCPEAVSHDIYLGTDSSLVANATLDSPEYIGRQIATSYTHEGGFDAGQTYYWRIDGVNGASVWKGVVWKFATVRTTPISLTKGIALDRFFSFIPPEATGTVDAGDVKLIKHMGFTFAKLLVNPQPMISGSTINTTNMAYLDVYVNQFLDRGVPVVLCIHPQPDFKITYLGNASGFTTMLGFYHDFAAYLAQRWNENDLVFQLMTEPCNNYAPWNNMWPQMYDQVRAAMPNHALILGGDQVGGMGGLVTVNPSLRPDNNVFWGFTYWSDANVSPFVFQGAGFSAASFPYLKNVPYPSNASLNPADYILTTIPSNLYNEAYNAVNAYCNENWNMAKQREVLQPLNTWNQAHGGNLKLFCYEMGTPLDPSQGANIAGGGVDPEDRIQFIHDKRLALEENNIGWAYWSYNETFTVIKYQARLPFQSGITKSVVDPATLIALGLPCGCGCVSDDIPAGDLNADCYVNFGDFAVIADKWLQCNEPTAIGCL